MWNDKCEILVMARTKNTLFPFNNCIPSSQVRRPGVPAPSPGGVARVPGVSHPLAPGLEDGELAHAECDQ